MNEKRILEEKNELLKTEKQLFDIEKKSEIDLDISKSDLRDQQIKLDNFLGKKLDSIDLKGQLKILKQFEEINKSIMQNLMTLKLMVKQLLKILKNYYLTLQKKVHLAPLLLNLMKQ